jgi:hypothetical protein
MSKYIAENMSKEILLNDLPAKYLKEAVAYCEMMDYDKIMSSIQYPMSSRRIEDNVSQRESNFIFQYMNNFNELLALFKTAKALKIEAMY